MIKLLVEIPLWKKRSSFFTNSITTDYDGVWE